MSLELQEAASADEFSDAESDAASFDFEQHAVSTVAIAITLTSNTERFFFIILSPLKKYIILAFSYQNNISYTTTPQQMIKVFYLPIFLKNATILFTII